MKVWRAQAHQSVRQNPHIPAENCFLPPLFISTARFERLTRHLIANNRPFSKMAATDLNELKLNWMKNCYQHWKEHLYFSNLAKFQHIRCHISLGNVRCNLTNLQTFIWLGVYVIPRVIKTSVNFQFFNLHFLSWYYTWYAETLQGF